MNAKQVIKKLIEEDNNISSVAELERRLDISNGTINKWDRVRPSIEALTKVADFFGVPVDYIIARPEDEETRELRELMMLFRRNEMGVPEEKREEFRKEVERYMKFVREELNE